MVIQSALTRSGYEIQKSSLSKDELNQIKSDLTVTPKCLEQYNKTVESFEVFSETNDKIIVPRFYGQKNFGTAKKIQLDEGKKINITFTGEMRDYQKNVIKKAHKHIKTHGGAVISLPCGRGKTAIAIKEITKLQRKTLVLVHKSFLLKQWMKAIRKFTNAKVGIIQRNQVEVEGKDIVIGIIHSICNRDYGVFDEFGFVVTDECHHASAKYFNTAFPKIVSKYSLGLSATPDRQDGTSKAFYWYIGNMAHKEKQKPNDNVKTMIYQFSSTNPKYKLYWNWFGKTTPNTSKTTTEIGMIQERNITIANIVHEIRLRSEIRKILILSERLPHLNCLEMLISEQIAKDKQQYSSLKKLKKSIKKLIKKYKLDLSNINTQLDETADKSFKKILKKQIKNLNEMISENRLLLKSLKPQLKKFKKYKFHKHTTGYYIGGMKDDELEDSEKADIIFATFPMASEGLDIPELNCVLLASPRTNVQQSTGRILRQLDYEYQPLIIDIDDQLQFLSGQGKKRREYYDSCKYILEYYKVDPESYQIKKMNDYKETFSKFNKFEKREKPVMKDEDGIIYE